MAFPTSPSNGDEYTNALGTKYKYLTADDKWYIISIDTDYTIPYKLGGSDGFTESYNYFYATHADVNAKLWFTFIVPETRADWKITFVSYSSVASRTDSGVVSAGAAGAGETRSDNNIFNGANLDLPHAINHKYYHTSTSTFSLTKGDTVQGTWTKDNNAGSGILYFFVITLTHS